MVGSKKSFKRSQVFRGGVITRDTYIHELIG